MNLVLRCNVDKNEKPFFHSVLVYHDVGDTMDYLKGKMAEAVTALANIKGEAVAGEDSFSITVSADGVADAVSFHNLSWDQLHAVEEALANQQLSMVADSREVRKNKGKSKGKK